MSIDKQDLNQAGQPILTDKVCKHGVFQDRRGNSACESCFDEHSHGDYKITWDNDHLKKCVSQPLSPRY